MHSTVQTQFLKRLPWKQAHTDTRQSLKTRTLRQLSVTEANGATNLSKIGIYVCVWGGGGGLGPEPGSVLGPVKARSQHVSGNNLSLLLVQCHKFCINGRQIPCLGKLMEVQGGEVERRQGDHRWAGGPHQQH